MALTQLPNRKPDAYTVDIQLEAREKILPSSIKATTWDLHGNRLLYTRDVWRYKVLAGSEHHPGLRPRGHRSHGHPRRPSSR